MKLTIIYILFSGLEKLVTYGSMRVFLYCIGEYTLLPLRVLNALGLELGTLLVFTVSTVCTLGMKKLADIYPKT